jgi:hypothetical protein
MEGRLPPRGRQLAQVPTDRCLKINVALLEKHKKRIGRELLRDRPISKACCDDAGMLIEWLEDQAEPCKYILSTLPEDTAITDLVSSAYQRSRIERDYEKLKRDFGLGHYEGRGWRGFHHHASLSIAAYGFLMAERLIADKPVGGKKASSNAKCLPFPRIASPAAALRAQRQVEHLITTLRHGLGYELIARLGRCPCCGGVQGRLRL